MVDKPKSITASPSKEELSYRLGKVRDLMKKENLDELIIEL